LIFIVDRKGLKNRENEGGGDTYDRNKDKTPEEYGERKARTNYTLPLPESPATSGVEFRCK